LDERQIIQILQEGLGRNGFVGEDVEVLRRGSCSVAVSVDTLVESTDVPPGMRAAEVARKSVAACVSDFAAKGVRPEFGVVSVTVPTGFSKSRMVQLARGFQMASEEFSVRILGGDTNGGIEMSISVALYGAGDRIVTRGGAKSGDAVFVTGSFGSAAAGLRLLLGGRRAKRGPDRRFIDAFCSPVPPIEFGVRARRYLTSAMDSSDGLARTLNEMAGQSKKRFEITRLPYERALGAFAARNGTPVEDLALFGGEEYEMVFTVPEKNITRVRSLARKSRTSLTEIGTVRSGEGVVLESGDGSARIPDVGWTHLAA